MNTLDEVIDKLHLQPLTSEGGMWAQTYRSSEIIPDGLIGDRVGDREICGSIYYLLTPQSFSSMHKLTGDELWFHHLGPALQFLIIYPDHSEIQILGSDIANGEKPQLLIPRGTYFGAKMKEEGEFTLASTVMSPAYDDSDFESGSYELLEPLLTDSQHKNLLKQLTGQIKYL